MSSSTIDDCNTAVRALVAFVLDMPGTSVRPANQLAPAGAQTLEFATVNIITSDDLGEPNEYLANVDGDPTVVSASLEFSSQFVASINFYRSSSEDPAGIANYSNAAFTRAATFCRLLQLQTNLEVMMEMGIGLVDIGKPRNLAAIADATWESRGQVDVTFAIVNQEAVQIAAIASAEIDLTVQTASGPEQITIEVGP